MRTRCASTTDALAFLERRRIGDPDAVTTFRLGFCESDARFPAAGGEPQGRAPSCVAVCSGSGFCGRRGMSLFRGSLVIPVYRQRR